MHPGIDPIAVDPRRRSRDLPASQVVEGGSTITQQVAKLCWSRGWTAAAAAASRAKVREAVIALRLEHRLSKREILALYLNLAPYGNQLTGAERASRAYFGHDASLLTPAQAAFLAALPQRPSSFNPYRDATPGTAASGARHRPDGPRAARCRLTACARPLDERLSLRRRARDLRRAALRPNACSTLAGSGAAARRIDDHARRRSLQRRSRASSEPNARRSIAHGAHNVAVVVLDNATGEWLAWEGSGDY